MNYSRSILTRAAEGGQNADFGASVSVKGACYRSVEAKDEKEKVSSDDLGGGEKS